MKNLLILIGLSAVLIAGYYWFTDRDSAVAEPDLRILLIGNSLTHSNDLPGMLSRMAAAKGTVLASEQHTPGGARFRDHARNPGLTAKLAMGHWDYVVLQEQSQYPGFSQAQQATDVYPYAKQLSDQARAANPQVSILMYMTMARRDGDPDNQQVSRELLTYQGAQRRVNASYENMAVANNAQLVPVGRVWAAMRAEHPGINLYSDAVHPNRLGTYLAACTFFVTVFGESCSTVPFPEGIDARRGQLVQQVVDKVIER